MTRRRRAWHKKKTHHSTKKGWEKRMRSHIHSTPIAYLTYFGSQCLRLCWLSILSLNAGWLLAASSPLRLVPSIRGFFRLAASFSLQPVSACSQYSMIAKLLKQTRKRPKLLSHPKARPRVPESDEGQFNRIEQERRAVPRPPDHPPPEYSPSVGILNMDQEIQRTRAASRDSNRRQKDAEGRQTVPPPAPPS